MNETRLLAEFVAETGYEDLPASVVEATRIYILDNLASGFVGSTTPWAAMVAGLARESAGAGLCSIFAKPWSTTASYAALVNGVMIGGFETDHAFSLGSCHPSASAFPAALAIGERDHLDGRALIASVALGYEAACRIGLAATRAVEDEAGFHGPGTNAPFGGAVGAGKALGLDSAGLVDALGIAGSHAGGLLEFTREGAMTKRIHVGRGAQMGLESALLANAGFTGPSTVLEGTHGFLKVYSPSPKPELLLEGLGERYVLMDMSVKAYACHLSFHGVIEGICRFKEKHAFGPEAVEKVRVVGTESMMERHGQRAPESVLGAQYSLPFSVAVAVYDDIVDPLVYSEEILADPRVRSLAASVDLSSDPDRFGAPGKPSAEVSLTVSGHEHTFSVSTWKGSPANPYTFDEMADKFRRYALSVSRNKSAERLIPEEAVEEIVEAVRHLESVPDVAELGRMVRARPS